MVNDFDYYKILGVKCTASKDEIRAAYKRAVLRCHPDKPGGDQALFMKVQEAYQILSDTQARETYDALGGDMAATAPYLTDLLFAFISVVFKVREKMRQPKENAGNTTQPAQDVARPPDLHFTVDATLDDIYRGCVKVLTVNVLRDNAMTKVPLGVSLVDFRDDCVFEGAGDNCLADIHVRVRALEEGDVQLDNILAEYDTYIEMDITLMEFYGGVQRRIPYLAGEELLLGMGVEKLQNSLVEVFTGKGMPYTKNGERIRGDCYVFLRIAIPKSLHMVEDDVECEGFLSRYFNSNLHADVLRLRF